VASPFVARIFDSAGILDGHDYCGQDIVVRSLEGRVGVGLNILRISSLPMAISGSRYAKACYLADTTMNGNSE